MSALITAADGWQNVKRPPSLFRRFSFDAYRTTRAFLDRLAVLSEETGLYPDLGFGTTYVNVTVHTAAEVPDPTEIDFTTRVSALAMIDPAAA